MRLRLAGGVLAVVVTTTPMAAAFTVLLPHSSRHHSATHTNSKKRPAGGGLCVISSTIEISEMATTAASSSSLNFGMWPLLLAVPAAVAIGQISRGNKDALEESLALAEYEAEQIQERLKGTQSIVNISFAVASLSAIVFAFTVLVDSGTTPSTVIVEPKKEAVEVVEPAAKEPIKSVPAVKEGKEIPSPAKIPASEPEAKAKLEPEADAVVVESPKKLTEPTSPAPEPVAREEPKKPGTESGVDDAPPPKLGGFDSLMKKIESAAESRKSVEAEKVESASIVEEEESKSVSPQAESSEPAEAAPEPKVGGLESLMNKIESAVESVKTPEAEKEEVAPSEPSSESASTVTEELEPAAPPAPPATPAPETAPEPEPEMELDEGKKNYQLEFGDGWQ